MTYNRAYEWCRDQISQSHILRMYTEHEINLDADYRARVIVAAQKCGCTGCIDPRASFHPVTCTWNEYLVMHALMLTDEQRAGCAVTPIIRRYREVATHLRELQKI